MTCAGTRHLSDLLRSDMDSFLGQLVERDTLLHDAAQWRRGCELRGQGHLIPEPCAQDTNKWPLLAAWRWLLPLPGREAQLSQDVGGHSAVAVSREHGWDMGHRATLPLALGKALCGNQTSNEASALSADLEEYAVWRQSEQTRREAELQQLRYDRIRPAIQCVSLLLLGLRRIRVEYARRITAWKHLHLIMEQLRMPAGAPPAQPDGGVHRLPSMLDAWFDTARGRTAARELRWMAPTLSVLTARIKAEGNPTGQMNGLPLMICNPRCGCHAPVTSLLRMPFPAAGRVVVLSSRLLPRLVRALSASAVAEGLCAAAADAQSTSLVSAPGTAGPAEATGWTRRTLHHFAPTAGGHGEWRSKHSHDTQLVHRYPQEIYSAI
ncbi:unnamed protein product [Symbiodinium sp. CCMP2456]|nr:unnamed protein product [Symbiodinium sp. CCMP2456]